MRGSGRVGRVVITVLLAGVGMGEGVLRAAGLPEPWATLSEASTDGYYRDLVHSSGTGLAAVARLPELAKLRRPRVKEAAEAMIELIGKKAVADVEAAQSASKLRSDEQGARMKILLGGLYESRGAAGEVVGPRRSAEESNAETSRITGLYLDTMLGQGGLASSASAMAEARAAASVARLKVRKAWEEKVFPAVRHLPVPDLRKPLLRAEITGAGNYRQVWSALRNVSGETLTNVTVVLEAKDGDRPLKTQIYFVRDWPSNVIIRPDPFQQTWTLTTGNPQVSPPDELSAAIEVWSDQGHTAEAKARVVGFYELRDKFVEGMVREGMRYAHLSQDGQMILEFTRVAKDGDSKDVEATLTRIPEAGGDKPEVIRYRGRWTTNRTPNGRGEEVVELSLKLEQVNPEPSPAPTPAPTNRKRTTTATRPPTPPSLTFRWDRPNYRIELKPGKTFEVQPLPETKPAK